MIDLEIGKLPPQATELENGVLGALLLNTNAMPLIVDILTAESFYVDKNRIIFECMLSLHRQNIHCDILSVTQELIKTKKIQDAGGAFYVTTLSNKESINFEHNAYIIQQKYILRQLIKISSETIQISFDEGVDCFDAISRIEKSLTDIHKSISVGKLENMQSLWAKVVHKNEIILTRKGLSGIGTGYSTLDEVTGGWQPSNLIILAARPKMGKTSLVCCFARNAAVTHQVPVAIFSLEMSSIELAVRFMSMESTVSISDFTRKGIQAEQLFYIDQDCKKLINSPIWVDDTAAIGIMELRSKARKLKREKGIKLIIVDYLQLMSGDKSEKGNREQVISSISRGLKQLAKELEIPVIALSQLNRSVETRGGDKRPLLSDLRESGCLIGSTKIYCPHHKKVISIIDLVHQKKFRIFATDFKKVKEMEATKCFKSGNKQAYEIELLNYQKIGATLNHKFLTPNGWRKLQDLSTSDSLAIPVNYGDCEDDYLEEEISLIGHFLSNGSALKKQPIRYTCNILDNDLSEKVMSDVAIACNNRVAPYFKDTIAEKKSSRVIFFKPTFHLTHGKTSPVADIMRKYGLWDKRAKDKFIPDELFFISHKKTFILLKSLFSGDGCAYYQEAKGRKSLKISYSSCSENLIIGIQQLLQKVGIISFITRLENKKKQVWFNLYISGKSNIRLFVDNIGFWNKRKQDIMISGWLKSRDNLAGWNKYEFNEDRTLCFMPIKLISDIGMQDVYDIEVPLLHNFIANGIVVHNSIEQDADIVMFIHRPEYYNVKEYEDGTPTDGIAEIIFAAHRNGGVGTEKLKFIPHLTKFTSLDADSTNKAMQPNTDFTVPLHQQKNNEPPF